MKVQRHGGRAAYEWWILRILLGRGGKADTDHIRERILEKMRSQFSQREMTKIGHGEPRWWVQTKWAREDPADAQ